MQSQNRKARKVRTITHESERDGPEILVLAKPEEIEALRKASAVAFDYQSHQPDEESAHVGSEVCGAIQELVEMLLLDIKTDGDGSGCKADDKETD